MLRIALFEDRHAADLVPLSLTRPVFELVCGQFSLRERLSRWLPKSEWAAFVRPHCAETFRETHAGVHVNDFPWLANAPTLLVNGRWLPTRRSLSNITSTDVGVIDDSIAWLVLDPGEAPLLSLDRWTDDLERLARTRTPVHAKGMLVKRPWDLVEFNASWLETDFESRTATAKTLDFGSNVEVLGKPEDVFVHPTARIDPFVVLDARSGPISIRADAWIQPFTRLEGPCSIGPGAQLFNANVHGATTIGPYCRIGGEIEASILQAFVNKYHYGFLGHSYVCPWVNLGAGTTNSDLKNDYSPVRVPLAGDMIDSHSTKVGCFIGDHTKTAVDSLFNTGSSIGVMCMVLPGGELLPKHIPSFTRVWHGQLDANINLAQSIETARIVMQRRGQQLTGAQEHLMRFLFEHTRQERRDAVLRFADKHGIQHERPATS